MVLTEPLKTSVKQSTLSRISTRFNYGAVGTNDTTPASSDTSLGNEVLRKELSNKTINSSTFSATLFIGTTEANGNTLVETGVFDSPSAGELQLRDLFDSTAKTDDINIYIDYSIDGSVVEN